MGAKSAGGSMGAALRVVLMSHATSLCVLLALAFAKGDPFPHGRVLACVAGGRGCGRPFADRVLRGAFAWGDGGVRGHQRVGWAAAIPVLIASFVDGTPGLLRWLGFVVAGVAIWMIAAGDVEREQAGTMALAIGAGAGFGIYFVALKYAGAGRGGVAHGQPHGWEA